MDHLPVVLFLSLLAWIWVLGAVAIWGGAKLVFIHFGIGASQSGAALYLLKHAQEPARLRPAMQLTILAYLRNAVLMAIGLVVGRG